MLKVIGQHAKRWAAIFGLVLVAIPVFTALQVASIQGLQEQEREAARLTAAILHRSHELGNQLTQAEQSISAQSVEICSPEYLRLIARMAAESTLIVGFGYVRGNKLLCTSFGSIGEDLDLGAIDFRSSAGRDTRTSHPLPGITDRPFNFLTQPGTGFTAIVNPDILVGMISDDPNISLGVISSSTGKLHARQGVFVKAWLDRLGTLEEVRFSDERYVVAIRKSEKFDVAAYAAIPVEAVAASTSSAIFLLVPLGIVSGFLLAFLVFRFTQHRMSMLWQFKQALRNEDLFLVYQPVIELQSGRWVGAEALLRWRLPDNTMVSPDVFIPIAEQNHLINEVTTEVIRIFLRDLQTMLRQRPDFHISINFSAADLHDTKLVEKLRQAILVAGLRMSNVQVEATERGFMDAARADVVLQHMRNLGIGCVIDDFGTGYSSLSYLTSLNVDGLKIDKAFVETIGTDAVTSQVVSHIIELSKSLKLTMIAEGVETQAQADYLRDHGVQYAQGWLFSKPLPPDEFKLQLVQQHQSCGVPCLDN